VIKSSDDELILMRELADPKMTRKEFAVTVSIMLSKGVVDWGRVNWAMEQRWGANGMGWIHREALKLIAEKKRREEAEAHYDLR